MSDPVTFYSPFLPGNDIAYQRWREWKLDDYPRSAADLLVQVRDPGKLEEAESRAILARCCKANAAIYQVTGGKTVDKRQVRELGRQFGLLCLDNNLRADEDSITTLKVVPAGERTHYIPYTNRPLNWHTDGYYNTQEEQVRGVVMHCVSESAEGGDNLYLDHEIAFLLMRDENPDYIAALMQPDVMTIPANVENGIEIRPEQSGPVFSIEPQTGALHMRYTARSRSITWKQDKITRLATGFLAEILASDSAFIIRHRLQAGQGVICNNVLHKREAFTDDAATGRERLLFRARYHDRIRDTGIKYCFGEAACSG
ncbi:MAG: TauD/TfdA family dioxygenase [Gammaproteobacteria bacterium]|nr:MAG: TauD/TfdA family dioxygenase [Gammaproteobacteria bacterium]